MASKSACGLLAALAAFALSAGQPHAAQTTQYTYDALGRVVSAIDASGKKVVYSYDSAGNRTRVSNGAEFTEITPTAWSASSNGGTTGLTVAGMKDGDFLALSSIHATTTETNAWVMADLGAAKTVNHIDVAPALSSAVGAAPEDLNATVVEYSLDGTKWAVAATLNAVVPGASRSVAVGGVSARYLRLRRSVSGQIAVGDLRLFSAAAANSPLIAQPDSITSSGSAVTFDPRVNDQDLDGYAFSVSSVEDPPHGTAVVNSGTSITYTPDPGYFGADSFLYSVADGHNGTASARVTVLVRPSTNHPPVAVDDSFTVSDRVTALVDGLNSLRPSGNDYDADGDVITITAKTDPAHGTVSIVGGNLIEYTPTVSYTGSDSFSYSISDGRGGTDTANVTLTLANTNPFAGPDSISVSRAGSTTFDPRLNDRDPNGDAITVASVSTPTKGTATLNGDQTITFTANPGISGLDSFTYSLTDPRGGTTTGSVSAAISGNSAPVAKDDYISASGAAVSLEPRTNDVDVDGDPLTVIGVAPSTHGTVAIINGGAGVTYTPTGGYTGDDAFTYTVSDNNGATATAVVRINALLAEYLVVAGGGAGGTGEGGGGGGGGLLEGTMIVPVGAPLGVTIGAGGVGAPGQRNGGGSALGGIAATGGGGGGQYPDVAQAGGSGGGGYSGSGGSGIPGQGYAGGNNSGRAGGGGGAGGAGLNGELSGGGRGGYGVDRSISGSSTNYAAGGGGAGVNNQDGFAQAGAAGGPSCAAGGLSEIPPAPPSNRGGGGGGGGGNIFAGVGGGAGGSGVVIVRYFGGPKAAGGTITQVGGYTIHTFTANGTFEVTQANRAPVANADSLGAISGASRVFDPRLNDSDPDGDALTISRVSSPVHGVVNVSAAGLLIYRSTTGYLGPDSFTYTITDAGASATATVSINVTAGPTIEYLIVGGGGGGGKATWSPAGGGGGGGVLTGQISLSSATYPVVVGAGGARTNGGDSSFAGLVALGGGVGGQDAPGAAGGSGGSGGGGSYGAGGRGLAGQGNAGGPSLANGGASGGGGGAGGSGRGAAHERQSGSGGPGLSLSIDGTPQIYGSGGGGAGSSGSYTVSAGAGGANAGSGSVSGNGGAGIANRGGGGGGGGNGGVGGSGIVILRYPTGTFTASGGTVTTDGGYTIHTFTSGGSFVIQ